MKFRSIAPAVALIAVLTAGCGHTVKPVLAESVRATVTTTAPPTTIVKTTTTTDTTTATVTADAELSTSCIKALDAAQELILGGTNMLDAASALNRVIGDANDAGGSIYDVPNVVERVQGAADSLKEYNRLLEDSDYTDLAADCRAGR